MPGPLSRQAHLLPRWFHQGEVIGNHVAQLVVPWFLFAPIIGLWVPGPGAGDHRGDRRRDRHRDAAVARRDRQLRVAQLGDDRARLLGDRDSGPSADSGRGHWAAEAPPWMIDGLPLPWLVVTAAVGVLYVVLSWQPLRNLFAHRQLMNASFNRWQLANAYGAFGTVTKERIEIVVEGDDG